MVLNSKIIELSEDTSISTPRRKSFNVKEYCVFYLSFLTRWCRSAKPSSDHLRSRVLEHAEPKNDSESEQHVDWIGNLHEEFEEIGDDQKMNDVPKVRYGAYDTQGSEDLSEAKFCKLKSSDSFFMNTPPLSRNASRRSPTPIPPSFSRNTSMRSCDSNMGVPPSFSRNASRRSSTPIMFSNSNGMAKPLPIERNLECTLEELCFGCTKKIKVTRDVISTSGKMTQQGEILTIKVKPGWKKGTKITFDGMGDERHGLSPADVTFVIAEKRHPLFRREGDNLEIGVQIPLVKALTGCEISIPLLGGEKMRVTFDDVIHPGYEKIIPGQGMPSTKNKGKRGNLKVVFLLDFPTELQEHQRQGIKEILRGTC